MDPVATVSVSDAFRTGWKPVVRPGHPRRSGFTFTEILFAVLILGIGFILIAAIFPVALKQTQLSGEETVAATIAKGGVSYLSKYNGQANWYATGSSADNMVHSIGPSIITGEPTPTNTTLWPLISGNLILPSDNRYAWVPMYRQGQDPTDNTKPLPYIQLIVIGVKARNRTNYDLADLATRGTAPVLPPTLEARPLTATFTRNTPNSADTVTLSDVTAITTAFPAISFLPCLSEGSYLVVSNDSNAGSPTNGWIYRLGNLVSGPTGVAPNVTVTYELAPGNDMLNATAMPGLATGTTGTAGNPVSVLIVGRGYDDGTVTTYSGPTQDVTAYTTFINVK